MLNSQAIHLAKGVALPLKVLGLTQTMLATKGAGKTWGMLLMMEQVANAQLPFVGIDPTGVMWGLKYSRTGKTASDLGVLVFGGDEQDLPLEPESGRLIARFVVESGRRVVLDISQLSKSARDRFIADFLEELYQLKGKKQHRGNLHLFWDETHEAAPQQVSGEKARVVGASTDIVTKGRSRGLGMTMVTQRPARLHKDLLDLSDVLYVMRTMSPRDWAAIKAFVDAAGDETVRDELAASRAKLAKGEAFIWSPEALASDDGEPRFQRFRFGEGIGGLSARTTFDSSKTPEPGEVIVRPTAKTELDLDALSAEIRATAERAKAEDPKALQKRVSELRLQNQKLAAANVEMSRENKRLKDELIERPATPERVEVPVLDAEYGRHLEKLLEQIRGAAIDIRSMADTAESHALSAWSAVDDAKQLGGRQDTDSAVTVKPAAARPLSTSAANPTAPVKRTSAGPADASLGKGELSGNATKLLAAAAELRGLGVEEERKALIAGLAGISATSGSTIDAWSELTSAGLFENAGRGRTRITDAGLAAAGGVRTPPTLADLHRSFRDRLESRQAELLDVVIDRHPNDVAKAEVAEVVGHSPTSGSTIDNWARLNKLGLIESAGRGRVRASSLLFPASLTGGAS